MQTTQNSPNATDDNLNKVFTPDVIAELKRDKDLITPELLEKIRSYGNSGKHLALNLLDLETDDEQYYLDAFGNRVSFLGNRMLKKEFTKLALSDIHKHELKRCKNDIYHYMNNYVLIKTKSGINFPELREYQTRVLNTFLPDENESIVSLAPRQSGKTIITAIYLSHKYVFTKNLNIGIVANKGPMAREFLANVKNILIDLPVWMQPGTKVWNKGSVESESKMRILTDVPTSDAFRGFTIAFLVIDEGAWIKSNRWDEFTDSIFPSQSGLSWKKNIILSTANGKNHFCDIVEGARAGTNGYVSAEVNWKEVPRYKSDGTLMSNEEFQKKIVDKHGIIHFNQNYGCEFVGSSHTLIAASALEKMKAQEIVEIKDGKLNIYEYPVQNHKYVMSVDAAKNGKDAFAVQIIDITNFRFVQVACASLQIDYLLMPEFLHEWCEFYFNPYLIIENNEGAGQSCADVMYQTYEYENLHFDSRSSAENKVKSRQKYPGFRTTTKTRKQILQTMKLFVENDKLVVQDQKTISEFMRFILVNNKYQADEGAHDDTIMSLALSFAPFCDIKNFNDMKALVKNLYNNNLDDLDKINFGELLTVGSFDDSTDEEYLTNLNDETYDFDNSNNFTGFN